MASSSRVFLVLLVFLSGCEWLDPDSNNANLINLSITGGELSPSFSVDTLNYTMTVSPATDQVTVVATIVHPKATMSINGSAIESGPPGLLVPLDIGDNTIIVAVRAENNDSHKDYSVVVTRPEPVTYTIGGSVSSLAGTLTLQNNAGDDLTVTDNGLFAFVTPLDDGADYDVTVSVQPDGQNCSISNGAGTVTGANISDIGVSCVDLTFTVGGSVSGLAGTVILQNNGGDDLSVTENGPFTFGTVIDNGADYDVTVNSQPAGMLCSVSNATGAMDGANVTNVEVSCLIPTFTVGGAVSGLTGAVVLQNNGGGDLSVASNGPFTFPTGSANGAGYDVSVSGQPEGQTCGVSNGVGNIAGANVTDISVDCSSDVVGSIFDWEWINPLPQGNNVMDFASDGAQIVLVGDFGTVRTSPDGSAWTARDPGTGSSLYRIIWGDNQFVAVGAYGAVVSSPDGVTWAAQSLGTTYTWYSVVWSGSQYVAVGQEEANAYGGAIATSADGETWSVRSFELANAYAWNDITWNGSVFAAVQFPNYIHTSPDGDTWSTTDFTADNPNFRTIATDGSQFVAFGSGTVYTSSDGTAWTAQAGGSGVFGVNAIWDGTQFMAMGNSTLYTSPDGVTWASQYLAQSPYNGFISVLKFDGQFFVSGTNGLVWNSADGTTWNSQASGDYTGLRDIIWNGSQFVAVGLDQIIKTSPDGRTWTTQNGEFATEALFGVAWSGSQFVAVGYGNSGQALTSPDGVTWTSQNVIGEYLNLERVEWGGGQFVAVGYDGTLFSSPDGMNWSGPTSGVLATDSLFDISWNGSLFVATGNEGIAPYNAFVLTSPDGMTWTRIVLPWYAGIGRLIWNGSKFVGIGPQAIVTSIDGLTWDVVQIPYRGGWFDLTWTGSQFVAVGSDSNVYVSPDGVEWTETRSPSGFYGAITSDGSKVVTISYTGHILVNDTLQ